MIRQPLSWRWRLGLGVGSFVVLALCYTVLSQWQYALNPSNTVYPTWGRLAWRLGEVCTPQSDTGEIWLWNDALATLWRLLLGILVTVLLALPLGLAMACYTPVGAFFLPPLMFLSKIPPIGMLPIFFVMVGTGMEFYIAMIVVGALPALAQTVYHAAKEDVPDELIYKAWTLGASQFECIWEVIFMHILPKVIDAVRLMLGPAMISLIAAEMLLSGVGLGYRLRLQGFRLDFSTVYIYLCFLGAVGLAMDQGLIRLRRRLCPWYGG